MFVSPLAQRERKGESCAAALASLEDFGLLIGGNEIGGEKVFCSAGGRLVKRGEGGGGVSLKKTSRYGSLY